MSKLSFRARALDAARPMAVFLAEELPDLPDHSAISRAVPAMPTGMEKDEECEHHLQRAICAGLIIPTPEVLDMSDALAYDRLYPQDYNKPRQLIHMQPLGLEQEVPDYDMDSEDEKWLRRQHLAAGGRTSELTELKFEETMEKLERGSGQTVVTLREARALAGKTGLADHILAAVYDYWLNKRLATQQPLLLAVRTEPRPGAPAASPYLAFRRRTEKMQTRKNRKNDESSYEKMVKLRRELTQVAKLLDLVRNRERLKRDAVRMTATVVEKRYVARDFSGNLIAEATAARAAVAPPIMISQFTSHHRTTLDSAARQRDKRQFKRRKHRHHSTMVTSHPVHHGTILSGSSSSSEGEVAESSVIPVPELSSAYTFRRKPGCQYHMPINYDPSDEMPWMIESSKENTHPEKQDPKLKYVLASIDSSKPRCVGFVRRRMGRGGRIILDRLSCPVPDDRLWESLGYTVFDSNDLRTDSSHYPHFSHSSKPPTADSLPNKIECETSRSRDDQPTFEQVKVKSDSNSCTGDVTIKTELDDLNFSDSEKLSRLSEDPARDQAVECADGSSDSDSISSCDGHDYFNSKFSFKGSTLDKGKAFKRYRDRNQRLRNARKATSNIYREDMKVMAELLVARQLTHHEQRVPDMSSSHIDNFIKDVWGNRLHFKPKPPDPDVNMAVREVSDKEDVELLTEHSPITVHVRLALPEHQQLPSENLFTDTSSFVTSEFTLADIYGDSIINPDPDTIPESIKDWSHTNGPVKSFIKKSYEGMEEDSLSPTKATFKVESENSSSNQTSVFLSSDGGPPSAASVNSDTVGFGVLEDSNHEVTNGIEWNDSNESDKIKVAQKKGGNGLQTKCKSNINSIDASNLGTTAVPKPEIRIFMDSDRSLSPSYSLAVATSQQSRIVPPSYQSPVVSGEKKDQNVSIVQFKTSTGPVYKNVFTSDGSPVMVAQTNLQSPVRKTDAVRIRGLEEPISVNRQPGGQQVVTLAMSRCHVLSGSPGTTSASDILGLVQNKSLPSATIQKDGVTTGTRRAVLQMPGGAGRAVRLVQTRPIPAAQRSRLISTPGGPLQIRGLTNLLQFQVAPRTLPHRRIETTEPPAEAASAGSTTAGTGGDASLAPSGPAPAAGPPPAPGKPPPPSPRKGQASLPMEVT